MNTRKKDTRWLASVALMMAPGDDSAAGDQGDNCTHSRYPGSGDLGAYGGIHFGRDVWNLFHDQQYDGAHSFVLCIFSIYEHDGNSWNAEGSLDFRWLQNPNRDSVRMAVDFISKNPSESRDRTSNYWICGGYGKYSARDGKHL